MGDESSAIQATTAATGRAGLLAQRVALAILLAVTCGRCFINEVPFRTSNLRTAMAASGDANDSQPLADRSEPARVALAAALLAAGAIWLIGAALRGRLIVRHAALGVVVVIFAAWALASALGASDKRTALDCWLEQVSLVLSGLLAAQMLTARRGLVLVAVMWTGLAGTMAGRGLWQYFIEIPSSIQQFDMYRAEQLRAMGWPDGTPQASMLEARLRDRSVTGFSGMANLQASMMILLAMTAGGLAWAKLLAARAGKAQWRRHAGKGEVHPPTVAGVLTAVLAALAGVTLLMTTSRAGIALGLASAAGAMLVWRQRAAMAAHWRRWMLAAGGLFVLAAVGVAGWGLAKDSLPGTSLTFRWYYWTAAARMTADRPLLGVGPGNFATAYLAVRRPAAEESVKMPHNTIAQALSEYGLPGGLAFLAAMAIALVAATRPSGSADKGAMVCGARTGSNHVLADSQECGCSAPRATQPTAPLSLAAPADHDDLIGGRAVLLCCAATVLAVGIFRTAFFGWASDAAGVMLNVLLPAGTLGAMLIAAAWFGRRLTAGWDVPTGVLRVFMAAGAVGFFLHGMVEFGPFMPATAGLFWVTVGACMAGGDMRTHPQANSVWVWRRIDLSRFAWPKAAMAVVAVAAVVAVLCVPVWRRCAVTDQMAGAVASGHISSGAFSAAEAVRADELDPIAAMDASRAAVLSYRPGEATRFDTFGASYDWALKAIARDGANFATHVAAADAGECLVSPDRFIYAWDPSAQWTDEQIETLLKNMHKTSGTTRAENEFAGALYSRDRYEQAAQWLALCTSDDPAPTLRAHLAMACWHQAQVAATPADKREALLRKAAESWATAAKGAGSDLRFLAHMAKAVELNPNELRLRLSYAQMLLDAAKPAEALEQIAKALWLNDQLLPLSVQRFKPSELDDIEMMRAQAAAIKQ